VHTRNLFAGLEPLILILSSFDLIPRQD